MGKYSNFDLKSKEFWKDGWGGLFLAILAALTIRWALFESYVIPSGSMLPTLLIQDHIFVNKLAYGIRFPFSETWMAKWAQPQRGDILVFKNPENMDIFLIKRVVGIPGDKIFFEKGVLYLNDQPLPLQSDPEHKVYKEIQDQDFKQDKEGYDSMKYYDHFLESLPVGNDVKKHSVLNRQGIYDDSFGPVTVPDGQYFMMGDNRHNSRDSRYWGFMPEDYVLGRAAIVWLACEEPLPVVRFLCDPLTIRWSRLLHSIE